MLLSVWVSAWERAIHRLCRCICVRAFYYCSHRVAYTALFPPVVILCFTCLILNRITHSIRLLPRPSVCLFVFQYLCPTVLFVPVHERQWTDFSNVVGAQTDYTVETDSSVCVCVRACVDVLEGTLVFVCCLCHQSNLVLMTLGLTPASNSVGKECVWMHACVSACMFMVVGATGHWLGPTRSCPVGIGLDVTAPPSPWCANQSQIQRQWLPVSWNISLYLNNFTWFQWLLLCHQASWRRMIPVNPPAPGNLNGIKWVIRLFC